MPGLLAEKLLLILMVAMQDTEVEHSLVKILKVDRSAAYAARYVAKSIVKAKLEKS